MDFKQLREDANLTLAEAAERSGYSIGTINGLELKGEGSARLRGKLQEIYGAPSGRAGVIQESAGESELNIWRRRAKEAEKKLADLRADLRALLEKTAQPSSSKSTSSSEELLDEAAAGEPDRPPRSRR